ncbi:MAG: hypothetical protein SWZ49_25405, partial [Cyanobacteriota bacterium]|nr:hypothetical protein [Cyanobacteriota bacterium]
MLDLLLVQKGFVKNNIYLANSTFYYLSNSKTKLLKSKSDFRSLEIIVHRNAVLPKFMTWLNQGGA